MTFGELDNLLDMLMAYLLGISPYLLEVEVFDHPSRTARLCIAYRAYMTRARNEIW